MLCAAPLAERYIALWQIPQSKLVPLNPFAEHVAGVHSHSGEVLCGTFAFPLHLAWKTGQHVVLIKDVKVDLLHIHDSATLVHKAGPRGGHLSIRFSLFTLLHNPYVHPHAQSYDIVGHDYNRAYCVP
jgi:hypothetical protein